MRRKSSQLAACTAPHTASALGALAPTAAAALVGSKNSSTRLSCAEWGASTTPSTAAAIITSKAAKPHTQPQPVSYTHLTLPTTERV